MGTPLDGKVALVTGGARGIGRGIALALGEAGAALAIADIKPDPYRGERYFRLRERHSGPEEATSTAEAVEALGRKAIQIAIDVAEPESVESGVRECRAALGEIDILVNNAGIVNNIARISEMTPEAWERELRVNLSGAFHCVRAVAPGMAERGFGRVVNVASIAAVQPGLGQPAYTASKAGLVAFTRSVAQEYGPSGVTANAILPGLIGTPLVLSMPARMRELAVQRSPVGRLGEPRDVGVLAAFLASPAASFITAAAIPCDGGLLNAPAGGLDG